MNCTFKIGDIVKSPDIWGDNVKFRIEGFLTNKSVTGKYVVCIAICQMIGKPETISNKCYIAELDLVLLNAEKRPFRNITYSQLEVLLKRRIQEAIREHNIRQYERLV
jgi:hypothetical protein